MQETKHTRYNRSPKGRARYKRHENTLERYVYRRRWRLAEQRAAITDRLEAS